MNSIALSEERDEETCYGYCDDYQPHAVKRMFDYKNGMLYDMRWDEAGNLGQVSMGKPGEMFERGRFLFWTEDCCGCEHRLCQSNVVSNRMHAAVDDKYFSYYVYDHSGGSCASREQSQACLSYAEMEQRRRSQRRLKLTGDSKLLDVCQRLRTPQNKLNEVSNADLMATYTVLNEPTLYPSSYMVLNNKGYTNVTEVESRASSLALPRCSNVTERKHYYAGTDLCASREQSQACLSYAETKQSVRSNRVAARLGGGGLDAQQHVIASDDELQWKADKLFKQSLDQVNHRVLGENDLNCIMRNKFSPEVLGEWIEGIPYHVQADVETEYWQFKEMVYSMLEDPNNGHEKEVFFYHSDLCGSRAQSQTCLSYAEMQQSVQSNHLGSASWITDGGGMAVQHIQYLPYGEPYINQRPFGYSERFTFTGKERDEETGFGYFGARYMDHELMTMWLSVDPMADKYPSISPYAYCAWNPVRLVDPDGRDVWEVDNKGNIISHTKSDDFDQIHIIDDDGSIRASSCQYVLGTISEFHIDNSDETAFSVCGKDDAEDLFVFFAENFTKDSGHPLEWDHAVSDDGSNFVGTSHKEASCSLQYKLIGIGYSIIENTHNHPGENPMPSIFALDPNSHGDLEMAKKHPGITNYVYTSKYGYTKYNSMGVQDEHLLELFSGAVTDNLSNCYDNLKWRSK